MRTNGEQGRAEGMDVVVAAEQDVLVLTVSGEVDVSNAPLLSSAIEAADDVAHVAVDLAGTSFIDLRGLLVLLSSQERRRRSGRDLLVIDLPSSARRILSSSGLRGRLHCLHRRGVGRELRSPELPWSGRGRADGG